ncbi:MAG: ATP-binding cassette domain-containing protein [Rhodomicrobiaceae bacterium]
MLEISNLRTTLIGPVNLTIAKGECAAILGPSGSGKSLLLRAIADLDPNEGSVRLDGRSREAMPAYAWRRLAALVPAESGWWTDSVASHFASEPPPEALLEAVGLADALGWSVSRLSSGERQQLALVRALQLDPQVLLLDEPTSSLDEAATQRVEKLLKDRLASGTAILLVTHDPAQADRLAHKQLAMQAGQLTDRKGQAA